MQTQRDVRAARQADDGRAAPFGVAAAAAFAGTRVRPRGAERGVRPQAEPRAEARAGPRLDSEAETKAEPGSERCGAEPAARPAGTEFRATQACGSSGAVAVAYERGASGAHTRAATHEDATLFERQARGSRRSAPAEPGRSERAQLWFVGVVALAGGLAWADGQRVLVHARRDAAPAARRASSAVQGSPADAPSFDIASAGPRELRRLPGIGDQRALALARARWQSGAPAVFGDLDAQPGIGPITAGRVVAWLREAGLDAGLAPGERAARAEPRTRDPSVAAAPPRERGALPGSAAESSGAHTAPACNPRLPGADVSAPPPARGALPERRPTSAPTSAPSNVLHAGSGAAATQARAPTAVGDPSPRSLGPTLRRAASTSGASAPPRGSASARDQP